MFAIGVCACMCSEQRAPLRDDLMMRFALLDSRTGSFRS